MSRLTWNEAGSRHYETGTRNGVLYLRDADGAYARGVSWNGLTGVTQSPSGADPSPIYADDIKYLVLLSLEEFGATVTAYTYPDEFKECDGTIEIAPGVYAGQQARKTFGLSYRTVLGNDIELDNYGYKLHLIYGAVASPSEKAYSTINDSPEAIEFSWELTTTPVDIIHPAFPEIRPTSLLTFDSTKVDPALMRELEDILYGTASTEAYLPLPEEVLTLLGSSAPAAG